MFELETRFSTDQLQEFPRWNSQTLIKTCDN